MSIEPVKLAMSPFGRVMVVGGAGFIGVEVSRQLLDSGLQVHVVDSILEIVYPNSGRLERLQTIQHPDFSFEVRNASDLRLGDLDGFDVVINLAAAPGLLPSWVNFSHYAENNLGLVGHLAHLCSVAGVHLIHASTSSVFGERALPGGSRVPNSPYGLTKLAAEQTLELFGSSRDLRYSILRLFSVYGPNQRPDQFFRTIVEKLSAGSEISVTGNGSQTRSNAYLADVGRAFLMATRSKPLLDSVDIAGNEHYSILQVIDLISEVMRVTPKISFIEARLGDQAETYGDLDKTRRLLGWEPSTRFRDGIRMMVSSLV